MLNRAPNIGRSTPAMWRFPIPAPGTIGPISTNTLNSLTTDTDERFSYLKVLSCWCTASITHIKSGGVVTDFLYWIFGGGHGDTGNDGVYAFRGSTGAFERMLTPQKFSVSTTIDATYGENVANRPDSQHTYQNVSALDSDDAQGPALMQLRGSAVGQGAIISGQGHRFDAITKTWSRYGSLNTGTTSVQLSAIVKDTFRKRYVRFPSDNGTAFYTLDYTLSNPTWQTSAQSSRTGNWSDSFGATGVYDPFRDLYIAGTQRGVGSNFRAIAAGTPTGSWTELTFTGTGPTSAYGLGFQYRSANDTFLMIDNSTQPPTGVWVLTPPVSSPLTNAWTWSRIALSGTSHFASDVAVEWHDRFQYMSLFDALLVCPAGGYPMEMWKL